MSTFSEKDREYLRTHGHGRVTDAVIERLLAAHDSLADAFDQARVLSEMHDKLVRESAQYRNERDALARRVAELEREMGRRMVRDSATFDAVFGVLQGYVNCEGTYPDDALHDDAIALLAGRHPTQADAALAAPKEPTP